MGAMDTEPRQDRDALREHEDQKYRHEHNIMEHEEHPRDGKAYHEMKEAEEPIEAKIGFEEKAARREQDVQDASLKEEVNTALRAEG